MDVGRNAGVTGLIDLPGYGGAGQKFSVYVHSWKESISSQEVDAAGRGDNDWPEQDFLQSTGNLAVTGMATLEQSPLPQYFIGQRGTVTIQYHGNAVQTIAVRVIGASLGRVDPKADQWNISLACRVTDNPAFSNFNAAQPTNAAEVLSDKELYSGLSKTIDGNVIQEGATQRIRIYSLTDTDSSEVSKIASLIAGATAPVANLKLRPVSFVRSSPRVSYATLQWSHRDTADDEVLGRTRTLVDPSGLQTSATTAILGGSNAATPPTPAPTNATNLVLADTSISPIWQNGTNYKWVTVGNWSLQSNKQALENSHTRAGGDPIEALTLTSATLIDSTNSALTDATNLLNTYHSTITYMGSTVIKPNPLKSLELVHSQTDNMMMEFTMRASGKLSIEGYVDDAGDVRVFVSDVYFRGNGWYRCIVMPQQVYGALGTLRLIRRGVVNDLVIHDELIGTTNQSPVISTKIGSGTLTYTGMTQRMNLGLLNSLNNGGGTNNSFPDKVVALTVHECEWSSFGHFLTDGMIIGRWFDTDEDLSGVTPGTWTKATSLGWTGCVALPQTNYAFLFL